VWHDAKHIADHIATQRKYVDYHDAAQRRGHASARQDDARLAPAAARPVVDAID
jgi:putative flavoprotein involved in K+ transport